MSLFQKSSNKQQPGQKNDENAVQLALDIGSSKIRLIAGTIHQDKTVEVLGYMETPSMGVNKGAVVDIALLSSTIAELIRKFTDKFKIQVDHLTVGVSSRFAEGENQQGYATVQSGMVTAEDRDSAIKNAKAGIHIDETKFKIVHIIPQNYITETSNEIYNPIGQYAKKISVCVHVVGIHMSQLKNIESVLKSINPDLRIDSEVNNDNAASDAVLTENEKEIGVCHIDIGKGTVGVSVYDNKFRVMSFGFDDGGGFMDDDIARHFGLHMNAAEKLRIAHGVAKSDYLYQGDYFSQSEPAPDLWVSTRDPSSNERSSIPISTARLNSFIEARLTNIFRKVINTIEMQENSNGMNRINLGSGFVITGGVANTKDIEHVLENVIFNKGEIAEPLAARKYRIGHPRGVKVAPGACDENIDLNDPDKSVIIGLLRCAQDSIESQLEKKKTQEHVAHKGVFRGVIDWLRREM